jgi:hypothetical protein
MRSAFPGILRPSCPWVPYSRHLHLPMPQHVALVHCRPASCAAGSPTPASPTCASGLALRRPPPPPRTPVPVCPGSARPRLSSRCPARTFTFSLWRRERCNSCTKGFGGAGGPGVGSRGARLPGLPWLMAGEDAGGPRPHSGPRSVEKQLLLGRRRRSGHSPSRCGRPRGGARASWAGRGAGLELSGLTVGGACAAGAGLGGGAYGVQAG